MTDMETVQRAVVHLAQQQQRRHYGKYRGIVVDNKDPDQQGRITAKVPELFGDNETGWAFACTPFAPHGHGFLMLPERDSNVWIEFEGGDSTRPIWTGCWWPQNKAPEKASADVKILETSSGNRITFDDTSGNEAVIVEDKNGAKVTLDKSGIKLEKSSMKIEITESQVAINDSSLTVM